MGNFRYRDTVFLKAIIDRVTPVGIQIRHDAGVARMSFPLLPEYLRNRYHYEPSEDAELL